MEETYSFHTAQKRSLVLLDYIVFSLLFVVSASVGFYHAYKWRNRCNEDEFHFAGRSLHPFPVSLSLSATFFSAITILGVPADVYTFNTMFVWSIVASFLATVVVAHVFVPFFYKLQLQSVFKYIELRFGKSLRLMASSLFLIQMLFYSSVALYLPCLTLQTVMGVSLWYTMVTICFVCALYTILGGMRSVIWVDTLQFAVIIVGLVAAVVAGSHATGGIQKAWQITTDGNRIKFDDFSVDPRTRHSFWSVSIGFSVMLIYLYGMTPVQVNRVCTVSSVKRATAASWLAFPSFALIQSLVCLSGIVIYAFYSNCDPKTFGLISKNDQLMPLFILDILGSFPGMAGLFLACIFSGSLSSISSTMNTASTVILNDFVKRFCFQRNDMKRTLFISRMLVFILACFQFLGAVLVSKMDRLIFQLTNSMYAVIAGPLAGLFVSGMFLPWANKKGATAGMLVSLTMMLWLCIASLIEKPTGANPLPTSTSGCNWNVTTKSVNMNTNTTHLSFYNTTTTEPIKEPILYDFYRMSYLWYSGLGMLTNVLTTLVVSCLTGCTKASDVDSSLICPLFDMLCPCLPFRFRGVLRCGTVKSEDEIINFTDGETHGIDKPNSGSRLIDVM